VIARSVPAEMPDELETTMLVDPEVAPEAMFVDAGV
jgi:hypothetical protein